MLSSVVIQLYAGECKPSVDRALALETNWTACNGRQEYLRGGLGMGVWGRSPRRWSDFFSFFSKNTHF